jgi:Ca-activated chloride channel homolog
MPGDGPDKTTGGGVAVAQSPRSAGRHARPSPAGRSARRASDGPPLGILILVGALIIGLIAVVAVRAQREEATTGAATPADGPCPDAVSVAAPAALAPAVESYAASRDGCLLATLVTSGPTDVRIMAGTEARIPDAALSEPVGSSPVVLAMPDDLASTLGHPDETLTGPVLTEVLGPGAWAERGEGAWGEFRIRLPQPETTTLGATGVSALVGALVGSATASHEDLPEAVGTGSLGRLARALQPVPSEDPLFPEVSDSAEFAASTSAVLTTEADLLAYRSAAAGLPLVGVVIGDGAASVPLRVRGEAGGLMDYLLDEEGQSLIRAAGYYGADGQPPTERGPVPEDLMSAEPVILDDRQLTVAPSLLDAAVRPRDVVVLVDASAGLREPLDGGTSRQLAVAAAAERVVPAGADVRLSLWLGGNDGPEQALAPELASAETLSAVSARIAGSRPAGTPDLATAVRETLGNSLVYARDPDRELVLLLVVPAGRELSDEDEDALLTYLRSAVRPDRAVRLSVVSLGGPSPDLDEIAAAGRGVATSASSIEELPGALTTAVVGR